MHGDRVLVLEDVDASLLHTVVAFFHLVHPSSATEWTTAGAKTSADVPAKVVCMLPNDKDKLVLLARAAHALQFINLALLCAVQAVARIQGM